MLLQVLISADNVLFLHRSNEIQMKYMYLDSRKWTFFCILANVPYIQVRLNSEAKIFYTVFLNRWSEVRVRQMIPHYCANMKNDGIHYRLLWTILHFYNPCQKCWHDFVGVRARTVDGNEIGSPLPLYNVAVKLATPTTWQSTRNTF